MNILGGEFLKRLRKQESSKADFSHYQSAFRKIAPLSYQLLGPDFLEKFIPQYLQEIIINPDSVEETIFYFPLFYKKTKQKEAHLVELMDYEFVCYQARLEPTPEPFSKEPTTHIHINPFSYAMRFEYDIHNYAQELRQKPSAMPKQRKNLLVVTKGPDGLVYFEAQILHAAIMDELHDGKIARRDCIDLLQKQFPDIPQRDWILALQDLKAAHVILETGPTA